MDCCIICSQKAVPSFSRTVVGNNSRRSSRKKEPTLEDQLEVVYFFQKFFGTPLLLETIEDAEDEGVNGSLITLFEFLLKNLGDPIQWADFCSKCSSIVRQAKELHDRIAKIEQQLRNLRSQVEYKLVNSHVEVESYATNNDEQLKDWTRRYFQTRVRNNQGNTNLLTYLNSTFLFYK